MRHGPAVRQTRVFEPLNTKAQHQTNRWDESPIAGVQVARLPLRHNVGRQPTERYYIQYTLNSDGAGQGLQTYPPKCQPQPHPIVPTMSPISYGDIINPIHLSPRGWLDESTVVPNSSQQHVTKGLHDAPTCDAHTGPTSLQKINERV